MRERNTERKSKQQRHKTWRDRAGFTLIEIAIVMIVLGIIVSPLFGLMLQDNEREQMKKAELVNEKILGALSAFIAQNGFYPCPANEALPITSATFGVEACGMASVDGVTNTGAVDAANSILIGDIPVRTLGLPLDLAANKDGWKYIYAVTQNLTSAATYNGIGGIRIFNPATGDSHTSQTVHFVIVNPGEDGKGTREIENASFGPGCGGAGDSENCDGDAVFAEADFSTQGGIASANYYDDSLSYTLTRKEDTFWEARVNEVNNATPEAPSDLNIVSRPTGNLGIGTDNPTNKLHVEGGDARIQGLNPNMNAALDVLANATITATNDITARTQTRAPLYYYRTNYALLPPLNCVMSWADATPTVVADGADVTAFSSGVAPCTSEVRTCTDGAMDGSFRFQSCPAPQNCVITWADTGNTQVVNDGANVPAFQTPGGTCNTETRTCNAGVLSGSFMNESCTASDDCYITWSDDGVIEFVSDGSTVTAFPSSTAPCTSQTRTCTTGVLSGSYTFRACDPNTRPCLTSDPSTVPHGVLGVTLYDSATNCSTTTQCDCNDSSWINCTPSSFAQYYRNCSAATTCTSQNPTWLTNCGGPTGTGADGQTKTINNNLPSYTGSAQYTCDGTTDTWNLVGGTESCSAASGICTLPWGGSINVGDIVTAYQNAFTCGAACNSEIRTCVSDENLSGSYTNPTCTADCQACLTVDGFSVPHGTNVDLYYPADSMCGDPTSNCDCDNGTFINCSETWDTGILGCGILPCEGTCPDDCPAEVVTWTVNGNTCTGFLPWGYTDPDVATATNGTPGLTGSKDFECYGGSSEARWISLSTPTPTCDPITCPNPFGGPDLNIGDTITAYSNSTCGCESEVRLCQDDGTLTGSYTNQSCPATSCPDCAGVNRSWLTNCSTDLPTTTATPSGVTVNANNTAPGYTGSADFVCQNDGTWSGASNTVCNVGIADCPAGNPSWGSGCSGNRPQTSPGTSGVTVANTASGHNGSATYDCDTSGNWTGATASSCNVNNCTAQTMTWGGGNCQADTTGDANGSTQTLANTASGYDGDADFTCDGVTDTWSIQPGSTCNALVTCPASAVVTWGNGNCSDTIPAGGPYYQGDTENVSFSDPSWPLPFVTPSGSGTAVCGASGTWSVDSPSSTCTCFSNDFNEPPSEIRSFANGQSWDMYQNYDAACGADPTMTCTCNRGFWDNCWDAVNGGYAFCDN